MGWESAVQWALPDPWHDLYAPVKQPPVPYPSDFQRVSALTAAGPRSGVAHQAISSGLGRGAAQNGIAQKPGIFLASPDALQCFALLPQQSRQFPQYCPRAPLYAFRLALALPCGVFGPVVFPTAARCVSASTAAPGVPVSSRSWGFSDRDEVKDRDLQLDDNNRPCIVAHSLAPISSAMRCFRMTTCASTRSFFVDLSYQPTFRGTS